jgi:ribosomal protein L3
MTMAETNTESAQNEAALLADIEVGIKAAQLKDFFETVEKFDIVAVTSGRC